MGRRQESADVFDKIVRKQIRKRVHEAYKELSPRPSRKILYAPGTLVAWDDCCDGQVWGRLVSITPLPTANPARIPGLSGCGAPSFIATIEVGVIRCAQTVDDQGRAPSAMEISNDGKQGISDMATILSVLASFADTRSIVGWTPQGPEGGCHGGYWTFTVAIPNCLQDDDEEPGEG